MTQRSRLHLIAGLSVLALGLIAFGLTYYVAISRSPEAGLVRTIATEFEIGGPFELTDHQGQTVTEADFAGKPSLVFFGFTHCPDICPTTLYDITLVLQELGDDADRLNVLFVSVDPERDTPDFLGTYLSSFHPGITGLTGTAEQVAEVARSYRAYYRRVPLDNGDYTMDHSAVVYMLDAEGTFISPFVHDRAPEESAAILRQVIEGA
ncbi:MAG: SCO family protein [Pseudomonadota bacterium]